MTRSRLPALVVSLALLGGFGLALARGENVSPSIPSKEEWRRNSMGEWPPEPTSLADFLGVGDHLPVARTVAIVTIGPVLRENPQVLGEGRPLPPLPPDHPFTVEELARRPLTGPPVTLEFPSTDYALYLDEVLSSNTLRAGDSVVLREPGSPDEGSFTPFPHPREGDRLLLVLVPDPRTPSSGTYISYPYGTANISEPKAHLADAWHTSVKEMGAPESTPAFIEAVRAALAGRP